jgi:hypothetical protein
MCGDGGSLYVLVKSCKEIPQLSNEQSEEDEDCLQLIAV